MTLVAEIVLTGGPCGGKTSSLRYLQTELSMLGYKVLVVPESATLFINGGQIDVNWLAKNDRSAYLELQSVIFGLIKDFKRYWRRVANNIYPNQEVVILYDRGEADGLAYMEPMEFQSVMEEYDASMHCSRDEYDAVIHLVTAANGAEAHYTLANNNARRESDPADAITTDIATQEAWLAHPNFWIIDNSTDFESKLKRLLECVVSVLDGIICQPNSEVFDAR